MIQSQSTRSRFMSESFGSASSNKIPSVTSRKISIGIDRFSIVTLKGQEPAFVNMEQAMTKLGVVGDRRVKSSSNGRNSKSLEVFRKIIKSVILLLRCFRKRRKFAVQSRDMTLKHSERTNDFEIFKTSSLSRELQIILSTPPEYRTKDHLRKVKFYLRATGASRLLASASTVEDLDNLSRYIAYERYENDRVVAQQGRRPDRFYFVVTGKLLIVKEYLIETGIISKTVGVLTKGMTTNIEEMEQRTLRKASMVCRGLVETLVLDSNDYFIVHGERGGAPRDFLSRHFIFKWFPFNSVKYHSHLIRLQYYPKGALIFEGGEEFEWIYAVKSGECSLLRAQIVTDMTAKNNPLFSKRTAEELGCQRDRRVNSAVERRADFRMWRGPSRKTLFIRRARAFPSPRTSTKKCQSKHGNISANFSEEMVEGEVESRPTLDIISTLPHILVDPGGESVSRPAYSDLPTPRNDTVRDVINGQVPVTIEDTSSTIAPTLSRSKYSLSFSPKVTQDSELKRSFAGTRSALPTLRQAYLELGKLKSGDVLGLEDAKLEIEDLPHVRLISDTGAEVVLVNRKFFIRNAPTSLLSEISYQTSSYPSVEKARSDYETLEAWSIYKASLMKVLKLKGNEALQSLTLQSYRKQTKGHIPFVDSQKEIGCLSYADYKPRYIPPGTADRSKILREEKADRRTKSYSTLPSRSFHGTKPTLTSDPRMKYVKGFRITESN